MSSHHTTFSDFQVMQSRLLQRTPARLDSFLSINPSCALGTDPQIGHQRTPYKLSGVRSHGDPRTGTPPRWASPRSLAASSHCSIPAVFQPSRYRGAELPDRGCRDLSERTREAFPDTRAVSWGGTALL